MNEVKNPEPKYGTWIRRRKLAWLWLTGFSGIVIAAGLTSLAVLDLSRQLWLVAVSIGAAGLAVVFSYIATVVSLTAWRFSPAGGDWQGQVHQLILTRLKPIDNGIAANQSGLDIGCGSGKLAIQAAAMLPTIQFTGLDFWGDDWEYSAKQCQRNAVLEGVENLDFRPGSAARLPFADGSFDLVISCLTFHEVQGITDRAVCLTEAIRVLRLGGQFIFLDLFDDPGFYPDPLAIRLALPAAGAQISESRALVDLLALPYPLKGKRALGLGRLICGTKT